MDASYFTAWKDGKFRYRDVRLEDIMRDVERWYDVKVVYEDEEVKEFRFGFNMGRHEMIDPLLRIFELNGKIKIHKDGKILKVKLGSVRKQEMLVTSPAPGLSRSSEIIY